MQPGRQGQPAGPATAAPGPPHHHQQYPCPPPTCAKSPRISSWLCCHGTGSRLRGGRAGRASTGQCITMPKVVKALRRLAVPCCPLQAQAERNNNFLSTFSLKAIPEGQQAVS